MLSGLLNCCSMYPALPREETRSSAFLMAPFMPSAAGVSTSLDPSALSSTRRSSDMESGMVSTRSYPLAAATMARPMPVLPEVGSTKVVFPGEMSPLFSASLIMLKPMRSLTELHGSMLSSFKMISAGHPAVTFLSLSSGVRPISSVISSAIFGCCRLYPILSAVNAGLRLLEVASLARPKAGRWAGMNAHPVCARSKHRSVEGCIVVLFSFFFFFFFF
mmetsp:Transcript_19278/g.53476  ORF Transcript_19278/g.53476 Transcript_19278/m.53476 type:complete len:219 (+) Transcript_19278:678-1334(+)